MLLKVMACVHLIHKQLKIESEPLALAWICTHPKNRKDLEFPIICLVKYEMGSCLYEDGPFEEPES
jgi:hypothetical protein